jgi:DNA-binding MarR family transcriptional regulator
MLEKKTQDDPPPLGYSYKELLTYRILVLSNTLGKGAVRFYTQRLNIPLAEWRLIAALSLHAPISMNALSAELNTDKGWISRTVAALAKKGYVLANVDKADGRKVILKLTPKGKALYNKAVPLVLKRQELLLNMLSQDERDSISHLLRKLQLRANEMLLENDIE